MGRLITQSYTGAIHQAYVATSRLMRLTNTKKKDNNVAYQFRHIILLVQIFFLKWEGLMTLHYGHIRKTSLTKCAG